jgi:hypothetical protein
MDLDYFFNRRIDFVSNYYETTVAAYEEIVRKIEAGEPPYVDDRHEYMEYVDEPPFLEEWEMAKTAITITGATCLDMMQSTLHTFLDGYMYEIGIRHLIPKLKPISQKKGWLGAYRVFFAEGLRIDWRASGANLDLIEQIILTRNDFTHGTDLLSLHSFQGKTHFEKYPDSPFVRRRNSEMQLFQEYAPLIVPSEKLREAIQSLRALCDYLEGERHGLFRRLRSTSGAEADPEEAFT